VIWWFPEIAGTPIAGYFTMENPNQKWMVYEYPHFRKPPYNCQQHVDNMLVKNPGNKNRTGNNGGF